MTDRFTIDMLDNNNWQITDNKTGEYANPVDGTTNVLKGLVKTMNKFYEENEQLKSQYSEQCIQLDFLKAENSHMKQVLEENEQLKQDKTNLHRAMSRDRLRYLNENEKLKQQINELQFNKALGQQEYQKRVLND